MKTVWNKFKAWFNKVRLWFKRKLKKKGMFGGIGNGYTIK